MSHSPPNMSGCAPTGNFRDIYGAFPSLLPPACCTDPLWLKDGGRKKRASGLGCGRCWGVVGGGLAARLQAFMRIPGPFALATRLLACCHGSHPTAHCHPAAALLVISHRDRSYTLSQCPSSTNQLLTCQKCRCLSAIA